MLTDEFQFKFIFKYSKTMDCNISCNDETTEIAVSKHNLQTLFSSYLSLKFYIHRKINGIIFPLTLRMKENNRAERDVYARIICNFLKPQFFHRRRYKNPRKDEQFKFWSESFIGKSYIDCASSSLSIQDCKVGFLSETEKFFTYQISCFTRENLKIKKFTKYLTKQGFNPIFRKKNPLLNYFLLYF